MFLLRKRNLSSRFPKIFEVFISIPPYSMIISRVLCFLKYNVFMDYLTLVSCICGIRPHTNKPFLEYTTLWDSRQMQMLKLHPSTLDMLSKDGHFDKRSPNPLLWNTMATWAWGGDYPLPLSAAGPSLFSAITCLPQGGSLPSYLCACGHSPQLKGTHHQLPLIIYYYTSICYINLYIFCNESVPNISFNQ